MIIEYNPDLISMGNYEKTKSMNHGHSKRKKVIQKTNKTFVVKSQKKTFPNLVKRMFIPIKVAFNTPYRLTKEEPLYMITYSKY